MSSRSATDALRRSDAQAGTRLWPFGVIGALLAVPAVWIVLGAAFWAGHRWVDWPTLAAAGGLMYVASAIGLVPIALLVLDAIAQRRGAVTTRWFSIDFGQKAQRVAERRPFEIRTGLGFVGRPLDDTSVVAVHETLAAARSNDIVRLDLGRGENWWMTRLFALCAGAAQTGAPEVIVFVGQEAGITGAFLGWTRPRDAFRLARAAREDLRRISDHADAIARHLTTVAPSTPAPRPVVQAAAPLAPILRETPRRYASDPRFKGLGEETGLRVLLDLLGKYEQLQQPVGGERVTAGVLQEVLGSDLRREQIDYQWPNERQLSEFLTSTSDYVALVDAQRFQSVVHRRALENAILRQLIDPQESLAAG